VLSDKGQFMTNQINSFTKGFKDGIPIALGYISVSFAFGISAVGYGLPVWTAVLISLVNITSAGQVAGLPLLVSSASVIEMIVTQLVINLRYALMSLSLSQKFAPQVKTINRMAIAYGVTDEIFAVSSSQKKEVGGKYMAGLIIGPVAGWTLGTFLGAAASSFLPGTIQSALGIAIYGMFIAIVIPPAKTHKPTLRVVLFSVGLSCIFHYVPGLNTIGSGFIIIICSVTASLIGALLYPIREVEK